MKSHNMHWKGTKVLVLNGGSRQILPIIKELHTLKCDVTTVCRSKLDNGYVSRYADHRVIIPQEEDYYSALMRMVKTGQYDVLLPLSDGTMDLVTDHYEDLSSYVRMPIPGREAFMSAYDKQRTMEVCMDHEIPCTITKRESEDLDAFIQRVGMPIVAKPRKANGSQGFRIIKNRERLNELLRDHKIVLEDYVIQEYVPQSGRQFNIHLFVDQNGTVASNLVTQKVRWYPVDGGASCLCLTKWDETIAKHCESLLKEIGWRSYCEIEMIEDPRDGVAKVMEINGRASASIKIMQLAGFQVAEQHLQLAMGEDVAHFGKAKDDVRLRCFITDVLWFLHARDRFSRKPFWFSPVRTWDALFSWSDPLPFFSYFLKKVPEYRNDMKNRQHQ